MIETDVLQRVLTAALRTGGEFAEVYAEDKTSTSAGLDDGKVEQVSSGRDRGAGIRVIRGETTGFAHTSDMSEAGLLAAAEAAGAAASRGGGGANVVALTRREVRRVTSVEIYPGTVGKAAKVALLQRMDNAARSVDGLISQVSAGYGDIHKRVLVANSDGLLAEDEIVRHLLRVSAIANSDGGMQTGFEAIGRTIGFELFDEEDVEQVARARSPPGDHKTARPPGTIGPRAGGDQSRQRWGVVPRGVRARSRGRPHRQGRFGVCRQGW